tara:strand:+ start:19309 stop:19491 length:183 start_codon:yes stop_codon:yes gene_type:complete
MINIAKLFVVIHENGSIVGMPKNQEGVDDVLKTYRKLWPEEKGLSSYPATITWETNDEAA